VVTAAAPGGHGGRPVSRPVALMLLTRDPSGPLTGRKTVLATAAASLEALGWQVEVMVPSRLPLAATWQGRPMHRLPAPLLPLLPLRGAAAAASGRRALNEVLFDDGRLRRAALALGRERRAQLVIADGVRLAGAAVATGLPVVAHLDDLLSDRYAAESAAGAAGGDLLGFYGEQLPAVLRRPAERVARLALRREAAVLRRREVEVAQTVAATAVTSPAEARILSARAGRPVIAAPMAVDVVVGGSAVVRAPATSAVFLGWLGYAPNLVALRWWRDRVRPELDRRGGADIVLSVIGCSAEHHVREFADERLRMTGYVEDLPAELRRHRVMVAPITIGTGLKTKVLDGMSVGLPVVGTPLAVAGLDVSDGDQAWIAADPGDFAERVLCARDDAAAAAAVGARGRDLLASTWSGAALVDRWSQLLTAAGASPQGRAVPVV